MLSCLYEGVCLFVVGGLAYLVALFLFVDINCVGTRAVTSEGGVGVGMRARRRRHSLPPPYPTRTFVYKGAISLVFERVGGATIIAVVGLSAKRTVRCGISAGSYDVSVSLNGGRDRSGCGVRLVLSNGTCAKRFAAGRV